eukprot:scaffold6179_cov18-Tisochrysis_lutea.AAC.1
MLVAGRALPPHAHNRLSTPYLQEEQYHPPSWANPYIKLIPHSRLGLAQLSPSITEIVLPSIRCHCAFKRAFSWCILSLKFLHTQKWDGFTGARTLTYMADLTVRKGVSTMPQNDMFGNCFILPCWPRQSSEEEALNLYTGVSEITATEKPSGHQSLALYPAYSYRAICICLGPLKDFLAAVVGAHFIRAE